MIRKSGESGFTLIEVVVVILVMMILAGAISQQMDLSSARAGSVARVLSSDLRYAQQLANITRVHHGVELTNATSYRVFREDGGAGTTVDNPMTGVPYVVNMVGDFNGVTLSWTLEGGALNAKVQFDSVGRPFDGTNAPIAAGVNTVDLLSSGALVETVSVEPNTGMVRVN